MEIKHYIRAVKDELLESLRRLSYNTPRTCIFKNLTISTTCITECRYSSNSNYGPWAKYYEFEIYLNINDALTYAKINNIDIVLAAKMLIGHEIMHVALGHFSKKYKSYDRKLLNIAGDLEINTILGITHPAMIPEDYGFPKYLDTKTYYKLLKEQKEKEEEEFKKNSEKAESQLENEKEDKKEEENKEENTENNTNENNEESNKQNGEQNDKQENEQDDIDDNKDSDENENNDNESNETDDTYNSENSSKDESEDKSESEHEESEQDTSNSGDYINDDEDYEYDSELSEDDLEYDDYNDKSQDNGNVEQSDESDDSNKPQFSINHDGDNNDMEMPDINFDENSYDYQEDNPDQTRMIEVLFANKGDEAGSHRKDYNQKLASIPELDRILHKLIQNEQSYSIIPTKKVPSYHKFNNRRKSDFILPGKKIVQHGNQKKFQQQLTVFLDVSGSTQGNTDLVTVSYELHKLGATIVFYDTEVCDILKPEEVYCHYSPSGGTNVCKAIKEYIERGNKLDRLYVFTDGADDFSQIPTICDQYEVYQLYSNSCKQLSKEEIARKRW